jgi:copper chaperone CopZ
VGAAITALPGIVGVNYDAREDLFTVQFDSQKTRLEDIFAAVYVAGRQSGRSYLPQVVS